MKNLTPQSKSKLQKEIADLTASHSDEQVYFEGIRALKDVEQHGRLLTDFDNIPKKSRRAIQRLVKVYGKISDISMGESNTVESAYMLYRYLQQYCFHLSIYTGPHYSILSER